MSLSNIFKGKKVITTNRKNGTLKVSVKDKKNSYYMPKEYNIALMPSKFTAFNRPGGEDSIHLDMCGGDEDEEHDDLGQAILVLFDGSRIPETTHALVIEKHVIAWSVTCSKCGLAAYDQLDWF